MAERLTIADAINGLIRTVSDRGYRSFAIRTDRLDRAFDAAYKELTRIAPDFGVDVSFRVVLDQVGKSRTFRDALNSASQRDLLSFDNPEYKDMRIDGPKVAALVSYSRLPGNQDLYEKFADAFLKEYFNKGRELAAS